MSPSSVLPVGATEGSSQTPALQGRCLGCPPPGTFQRVGLGLKQAASPGLLGKGVTAQRSRRDTCCGNTAPAAGITAAQECSRSGAEDGEQRAGQRASHSRPGHGHCYRAGPLLGWTLGPPHLVGAVQGPENWAGAVIGTGGETCCAAVTLKCPFGVALRLLGNEVSDSVFPDK